MVELNAVGSNAFAARLAPDELTIYFASDRNVGQGSDLFVATRASMADAFGAPTTLATVATTENEGAPWVSDDGLRLYFSRGIADPQLFVATRSNVVTGFGSAAEVEGVNSPQLDGAPYLSPDELTLYFGTTRSGARHEVYRSTRPNSTSPFGLPALLADLEPLDGTGFSNPVVTRDGKTIYFDSDRAGGLGVGDVYRAQRSTAIEPFGAASNASEINSDAFDTPSWISPDGCRFYFSSNRSGGTGAGVNLYVARRPAS